MPGALHLSRAAQESCRGGVLSDRKEPRPGPASLGQFIYLRLNFLNSKLGDNNQLGKRRMENLLGKSMKWGKKATLNVLDNEGKEYF